MHINVAELEAVARGINLVVTYGYKSFYVATDSKTVLAWLGKTVFETSRVHTKAAAEMLIKRRLQVVNQVVKRVRSASRVLVC